MSKLWGFGCSFTNYCWPTWCDILGQDLFAGNYVNYGLSGADAHTINLRLQQAINTGNIKSSDTVICVWSTTHRFNTYLNQPDGFLLNCAGNIYNSKIYKQYPEFVHEHLDDHNMLYRTVSAISSAYYSLLAVGCDFQFYAMNPVHRPDELMTDDTVEHSLSHILAEFATPLQAIRATYLTDYFRSNWDNRPWRQPGTTDRLDTHPLPVEHAEFVAEHMGYAVNPDRWLEWAHHQMPHWRTYSEFCEWRLSKDTFTTLGP